MQPQPLLVVTLASGEKRIVNELQVAFIDPVAGSQAKAAMITMSCGDRFMVIDPNYEVWERDCLGRK